MSLMEPSATAFPEREKILAVLMSTYRPKQRLRKADKDLIKKIKSVQQGYDGTIARCYFCKQIGTCDKDLQLHHLDYIESHNMLENLEPAHQGCNSSDHGKRNSDPSVLTAVCECARVSGSQPTVNERTVLDEDTEWRAKEGAKHDIQRPGWDRWVTDLVNGPFASPSGRRVTYYKKALSEKAPWGIGRMLGMTSALGNSVTYRRYIDEDAAGGILGWEYDDFGKKAYFLTFKPKTESTT